MTKEQQIKIQRCIDEFYSNRPQVRDELGVALQVLYEVEPQRAYEQGIKDTLDKYDETFRMASDIRCAMGCKTAKECRDLISNGEIQRVKHGRWLPSEKGDCTYTCSECGFVRDAYLLDEKAYCPRCGAKMDL